MLRKEEENMRNTLKPGIVALGLVLATALFAYADDPCFSEDFGEDGFGPDLYTLKCEGDQFMACAAWGSDNDNLTLSIDCKRSKVDSPFDWDEGNDPYVAISGCKNARVDIDCADYWGCGNYTLCCSCDWGEPKVFKLEEDN
jgi:hypothetical protein